MFGSWAKRQRRLDPLAVGGAEPTYSKDSDPARGRLVTRIGRRLTAGTFAILSIFGGLVLAVWVLLSPAWSVVVLVAAAAGGAAIVARLGVRELTRVFSHEDRLVRSLAHEIRKPLQRLFAAADLGLEGNVDPAETLPVVVKHAEILDVLLGDLLEAAQVISGSKVFTTDDTEITTLIDEAWEQLGDSRIVVSVTGESAVMRVNRRLVRLAVTNLLRNAALHGYAGLGGEVLVSVEEHGIRVRDHGVGIDAEELLVIREALTNSFRRTGAGVGLSLTAWVVDIHQGELIIDNHPDGGAEIQMHFGPPTPT